MSEAVTEKEPLSIAEMVRVLDVASEVRKTESLIRSQWDIEDVKRDLRNKLLATAETTGEQLTADQVDAAIDWYYERLHRFQKPKVSVGYYLAHLYVRRRQFAVWILLGSFVGWLAWLLASAFWGGFTSNDAVLQAEFVERIEDVEALMKLDDPRVPIDRWQRLAAMGAVTPALRTEVEEIHDTLTRQYGVVITDWYPERSGLGIDWEPYPETPGMENGRYVLMKIDGGDDRGIGVTDARTNQRREVRVWCQAIPEAVRERDRVYASRYFAYKYPGLLDLEVVLEGGDGQPVRVGPQLHVDLARDR